MDVVGIDQFVELVRSGEKSSPFAVEVPGTGARIPVAVAARPLRLKGGEKLAVVFHGAVTRKSRRVPAFPGKKLVRVLPRGYIVLSVSDPTLLLSPAISAGWYAGSQGCDVPQALRAMFAALVEGLQLSRVVFVGGSAGGHPALVQSSFMAGSVAVVENPILHISAYVRHHVQRYREVAWPGLPADAPLPECVNDAVSSLYAQPGANTVIYLQNARDGHFWKQTRHFLARVHSERKRSVLFLSQFIEEMPGHSFPRDIWYRWARAALEAPTTSITDIGVQAMRLQEQAGEQPRRAAVQEQGWNGADVQAARQIYLAALEEGLHGQG